MPGGGVGGGCVRGRSGVQLILIAFPGKVKKLTFKYSEAQYISLGNTEFCL